MKGRLVKFIVDRWQPLLIYGGLFGGFALLLLFRIGRLLPGYSASEVQTYQASISLRGILDDPINAPFTIVTHLFSLFSDHSYLLTRLTAVGFAIAALAAFCWLLVHWFGQRTAILGTVLFGTSAWFLHVARFGSPDILLFLVVILVACGVWLKKTSNPIALILCFGLSVALLYVPGMVWFVALGAIWERRTIARVFKHHLLLMSLASVLLVAAVAPLGWAIYNTHSIGKVVLGLPTEGWPSIVGVLQNLYQMPLALIFRYFNASPEMWLGHIAILDIFTIAMLFMGGIVYFKHVNLQRVKLAGLILLLSAVLISLGGSVSLSLLIPFVYIVATAGIDYMIRQWYVVFPRNPIAHVLATTLIAIAVVTASSYQIRHYFIAWPRNVETKTVYTASELPVSDTIK